MKRAMAVIRNVIVGIVVVIAVSMMLFTIISVSTFNRNDRNLFGYKAFIVLSESMSATDFAAGDLILVKEVDPATLQEGDIIAFTSSDTSNFGEVVTHKIRTLTQDGQGNPGFITYGTTTDVNDETIVTYPYILGKYVKTVPYVGRFFQFLKTTPGYIICILIPFDFQRRPAMHQAVPAVQEGTAGRIAGRAGQNCRGTCRKSKDDAGAAGIESASGIKHKRRKQRKGG